MKFITKIPSCLGYDQHFLDKKYRHKAAITRGGKLLSYGECTLGGTRFLGQELGSSCHAEMNALKKLINQLKVL